MDGYDILIESQQQKELSRIEEQKEADRISLYEYVRDFGVTKADTENVARPIRELYHMYDTEKLADASNFILNLDQRYNYNRRYKDQPDNPATQFNEIVRSHANCHILDHYYPLQYTESGGIFKHTTQLALLRQMQSYENVKHLEDPQIQAKLSSMLTLNRIPPEPTYDNVADLAFRSPEMRAAQVMLVAKKCMGNLIEKNLPPLVDYGIPKIMEMLYTLEEHITTEVAKSMNFNIDAYDTNVMNEIYRQLSQHILHLDWSLDPNQKPPPPGGSGLQWEDDAPCI